ncbi:exodeoxyribonuclease V subunit beta [Aggregatibacter actinomycetemcomitans]|uniref:exodeoxyribonuclease V subunit beta n=1 Tax=Aggregatibacter actinomycetemcomitans TaxID=714 RepID=UPI00197B493B|nr:exodeoxyribonuclease V subunit beta [Aggregatibacter actinomycetemcomitans]MBN6067667.1 exodeoxyribonuclease V subunit beta [Aggregatibacter actinomycetemcomitans]MBN6085604.1 exodeoxyribonuclease V subunit beta [Aggregatibacter actinomycetemcomitans]
MQPLNPISIPLNAISLIEASAGTGKTYTMGSLYLRLLLQAGENAFPHVLNVEQILVVTFTEMATEELKRKIRERIYDVKQKLTAYQQIQDSTVFEQDEFLRQLADSITDFPLAIQRLTLAEQNMDLAAIYTIHGFCRRMLMQYAFNSGIHFNLELSGEEDELLLHLAQKLWRAHFYSQPYAVAEFIQKHLISPANVIHNIKKFAGTELKLPQNRPHFFDGTLPDFLTKLADYSQQFAAQTAEVKKHWLENEADIAQLLETEVNTKYKSAKEQKLNRRSFTSTTRLKWLAMMKAWAESDKADFPGCFSRFGQTAMNEQKGEEAKDTLMHWLFVEIDELLQLAEQQGLLSQALWFHYLQMLNTQLVEYKLNHSEKSFNDLLRLLKEALYHPDNMEFSRLIRYQFPFAMIDEFQDTDAVQYQIFSKIYVEQPQTDAQSDSGFIMIGDPKQAIYKFRGADIFTYFQAARQAQHRFNLTKNYRSHQHVVDCVNRLFDFSEQPPFLYKDIQFMPVGARTDHPQFWLSGQPEPAVRFYVDEASVKENMAKACAVSIQYWLQSAVENSAVFRLDDGDKKTLKPESIAVLVRSRKEAELVKNELRHLGIASVYLSEDSNVFDSSAAKDLLMILTACLNPFSERHILNAIATAIFAQTSADIQRIRMDETRWEHWVEKFIHYQRTWQKQGVLVMLHQLFQQEKITEKLYPTVDGKRLVTDLLHLAELLQEAATLNESEAALLRWFEKQIQGENRQKEQQVRLESELQLVKIVTIHKSKGLEYDLVWLPFIGYASTFRGDRITTYYDETQGAVLWDYDKSHEALVQQEDFAEQLRLLYVALTRAKYQLVIGVPQTFETKWSSLLYVLTHGAIQTREKPNAYDSLPLLEKLVARALQGSVQIANTADLIPLPLQAHAEAQIPLHAAKFTGNIEQNWTVTSFSAIEAIHQNKAYFKAQQMAESAVDFPSVFDLGKDYDFNEQGQSTESIRETAADESAYPFGYSPFDFPHGINIGTALHRFLEKTDFDRPLNEDKIQKLCQWLQLEETWLPSLQQWINAILHTPLSTQDSTLQLVNLTRQHCVKEMQFYLKLNQTFDVTVFNQALQQHHHLPSEPLQFEAIKGMLRGFMDLVFYHNGKYYLADYKSNFLGVEAQNYVGTSLQQAMLTNHYDWQYLFYTLALHRYLQQRDANYDYDTHFGGVFYCFLRGMNGENQNGVFFDKPDYVLIQALENLF